MTSDFTFHQGGDDRSTALSQQINYMVHITWNSAVPKIQLDENTVVLMNYTPADHKQMLGVDLACSKTFCVPSDMMKCV